MYTWSRILVSWEVGLQELNEWLESQVRIKWPAPLLMRKPLVLLRGLAGSILALIKMIIAVVLREVFHNREGPVQVLWSGVPSRAVFVVSTDQKAERSVPDRSE